jgi:Sec-independent protein translocase protein TatA
MPFLSPAKLLIILVVAVIVLGPDKLPKFAHQVGNLWRDLRRLREKLESEVRGNFPDLPSTETITRVVRSPLSFLDGLADSPESEKTVTVAPPAGGNPDLNNRSGPNHHAATEEPPGTAAEVGVEHSSGLAADSAPRTWPFEETSG